LTQNSQNTQQGFNGESVGCLVCLRYLDAVRFFLLSTSSKYISWPDHGICWSSEAVFLKSLCCRAITAFVSFSLRALSSVRKKTPKFQKFVSAQTQLDRNSFPPTALLRLKNLPNRNNSNILRYPNAAVPLILQPHQPDFFRQLFYKIRVFFQ